MGVVVDLAAWRQGSRERQPRPKAPSAEVVERLEAAVDRLHEVVGSALERGRLPARVETEMLAIMGEIAIGGLEGAAGRAERLSRRLAAQERAARSRGG